MKKKRSTQGCSGVSDEMRETFKSIRVSLGRLKEGNIDNSLDNLKASAGGLKKSVQKIQKELQATHELIKKLMPPDDAPEDLFGLWGKCPRCGFIMRSKVVIKENMICRQCGHPHYPHYCFYCVSRN